MAPEGAITMAKEAWEQPGRQDTRQRDLSFSHKHEAGKVNWKFSEAMNSQMLPPPKTCFLSKAPPPKETNIPKEHY